MDVALRLLHIVSGMFWLGTFAFVLLVAIPQARKLGTAAERSTFRIVLSGRADLVVIPSYVILIGTGMAMALRLREASVTTYLATGWGLAMLVATIMVVLYTINALVFMIGHESSLRKLLASAEGREPTEAENERIKHHAARLERLWQLQLAFLLIAAIAMPVARFV